MNILSFSRMKSYKKDGRVRIIVKIRLPRICGENCGAEVFNSFYEMIADGYINSAEKCRYCSDLGARPTAVCVDFSCVTDGYIQKHKRLAKKNKPFEVIKREVRINTDGEVRRFECFDVYDTERQTFVK